MDSKSLTKLIIGLGVVCFIIVIIFFQRYCLEDLIQLSIITIIIIVTLGIVYKFSGFIKKKADYKVTRERALIAIILLIVVIGSVIIIGAGFDKRSCATDLGARCAEFGGQCKLACGPNDDILHVLNGIKGGCSVNELCCQGG